MSVRCVEQNALQDKTVALEIGAAAKVCTLNKCETVYNLSSVENSNARVGRFPDNLYPTVLILKTKSRSNFRL